MTIETTRAAFEAWAEQNRYTYDRSASNPDNYRVAHTQVAWEAWSQALQSPEIQALRKDAERYRWLRDPCSGAERVILYSRGDYGKGLMSGSMLDEAIDHARRVDGEER